MKKKTLFDYMALIKKLASKYATYIESKGVYSFQDLIQEGIVIYYMCKETYNPQKASFTTYFYICLNGHYLNIIKREKAKEEKIPENYDFPSSEKNILFYGLSREAEEYLEIVNNPPKELTENHSNKRKIMNEIAEILGISEYKVRKIKEEIIQKSLLY